MRALLAALRDGRLVALVADRNIGRRGLEVEFFGERTSLPAGPAVLALRTAPVLRASTAGPAGRDVRSPKNSTSRPLLPMFRSATSATSRPSRSAASNARIVEAPSASTTWIDSWAPHVREPLGKPAVGQCLGYRGDTHARILGQRPRHLPVPYVRQGHDHRTVLGLGGPHMLQPFQRHAGPHFPEPAGTEPQRLGPVATVGAEHLPGGPLHGVPVAIPEHPPHVPDRHGLAVLGPPPRQPTGRAAQTADGRLG